MKIKIITLFLLTFILGSTYGQELQRAPINEEFEKFISQKSKEQGDYIIPFPVKYAFSDLKRAEKFKVDLPDVFDLRDSGLVSNVGNQGTDGHCWTFAAIGAVESRSLKFGFSEYDLSEHNMATCHGYELEQGGNQEMATAYYSRLSGPILETEDPYVVGNYSCSATGVTPQFYVTEANFLPENMDIIKYMLMNNGAIAVSLHWADGSYNGTNYTYYYSGDENTNHGVLLVGWDDTKATAGGTGAWIIKNSWGASWGENGFFYMSYNDTYSMANATIYPTRKEINNIDTLLMIDDFGNLSNYGYGSDEAYALIKYEVSESYNFYQIGTYMYNSNSIVDIEVFDTKNGDTLEDTLAVVNDLLVDFPGFYTFDVPFSASGDFYIKIKYFTPGYTHPVPVEREVENFAYPQIESDKCWISFEGLEWSALGSGTSSEVDLCIRAYGSKSDVKASFISNYEMVCSDGSVTFTSNSTGDIIDYSWDFGAGASPATASTEGPHAVTYSTDGFKTIKLVVENSTASKDSLINYDYIKVGNEINVYIPKDTIYIDVSDTVTISAYGSDTYIWQPSGAIIGSDTNSSIIVSPDTDTTYIVEGHSGSCMDTDSIRVIITYAPENDDVCDAIELVLNTEEGPFTNEFATVQVNEPFPDTTGSLCTTPGYWCSEGGLQNSVWFKFVAPNSGVVSITTDGFDNQIAVYDAASCSDIVSGNPALYEIVAANDDYSGTNYDAIIDEITGLTSGKTYWLQMDGSAGGDEGECTITITDLASDNDSPCNAKTLEFFTDYSENNNYASIDTNEPMPDDSDCSAQNSWCPDDTLNATVWYKFAATSSGVVSIASTGFDNQIAVYSASECADLLSGDPADYTILGANDNYEGSNAASIYSITGLTEGTDYWIQVDGKNSDFYGSFTLHLKEWPLSTEDIIFGENKIIVFPNPSNGEFKINLSNVINTNKSNNLSIEVVTTDGSVLYKYKGTMNQNEFDISIDRKGLFIVRIITDDHQYSVPVVIK